MRTAGIFEAKKSFSALIDAVAAGEEVRITRHGTQIATHTTPAVVAFRRNDPSFVASCAPVRRACSR